MEPRLYARSTLSYPDTISNFR